MIGFLTGVLYLIALFYSLTDVDSLFETTLVFPLGEIYRQVSGSNAGAIGLLFLVLAPSFIAAIGCYLTASRVRNLMKPCPSTELHGMADSDTRCSGLWLEIMQLLSRAFSRKFHCASRFQYLRSFCVRQFAQFWDGELDLALLVKKYELTFVQHICR